MKTVIFDMDGVLIDSEHVYQEIEEELFVSLGLELDLELKKSFVGTSMVKLWTQIKEEHGFDYEVEHMMEKERNMYLKRLDRGHIKRIDGSYELMSKLYNNGYKLGLGTASQGKETKIIVDKFGFSEMLGTIVTSSDVENSKPFPDIYLKVAQNLSVPIESCVIIEDSANGISAAKAAGAICIAHKNDYNADYSKADLIVDSLYDIDIDSIENL